MEVKMEIERKYLVKKLPENLEEYRYKEIEQGYLCHKPTVRIRKINDKYVLTYKSKVKQKDDKAAIAKAIVNNEIEMELTEEAYMHLRSKVDGNLIHKRRYYIPLDSGLTVELDVFEDQLKGFIMAEVEFPSVELSDNFIPPEWFGKELTNDKRFSNYNLSKLSAIDELAL